MFPKLVILDLLSVMASSDIVSRSDSERQYSEVDTIIYTDDQLLSKYGKFKKEKNWKTSTKKIISKNCSCSVGCLKRFALAIFPILQWLPKYKPRQHMLGDFAAGITVAIVHLPQGMAYGLLASLPPVTGLYVSFFPVLVYVFFGTSRHVSIGTFAVVSLMTAQVVNDHVPPCSGNSTYSTKPTINGSNFYNVSTMSYDTFTAETTKDSCEVARTKRKIQMAVALSVANGLIQVTMSVLRLGIITIYLSEHLVSGFTCGAAFHVLTSQIPKLLGINVKRYSGALALVYTYIDLFKDIITINWATFVVSLCCTLFLIAGKEINARFHDRLPIPLPWELAIVILSTIVSYFGYLNQKYGVEIVEEIPTGIETSVPVASDIGLVFLEAIPIAIVAFAIEISLSQMFAVKHSYKIDSDQELLALGIGNIFGSFFSCFPTAASLSRSVIWEEVGAHSQITGLFSSVWILIILLWIGPLFESLPQAALAVIIVVNLKGLLKQFEKIRPLWKVSKLDALSWIVTWSAVVFLGVSLGLGVAVAFGLFTIVLKSQRVRGVTLVAVGNGDEYRDVQKYQTRFNNPKAVVFSFPGPIMFANKKSFHTQITKAIGFDPTMQTNTSSKRQKDNEVCRRSSEIDDRPFIKESSQNNNVSNSPSTSTPLAEATVFVNTHDVKNHKPAVDDIKFPANTWSVGHGSGNQIVEEDENKITHFILDLSFCSFVDNDGAKTIKALYVAFEKLGVNFHLASCNAGVRRAISTLCEEKRPLYFTSVQKAMQFVKSDFRIDDEITQNEQEDETVFDTRL